MVTCFICKSQFSDLSLYMAHLKIHSHEGKLLTPAYCIDCNTEPQFGTTTKLRTHLAQKHFKEGVELNSNVSGRENVSVQESENFFVQEPAMQWEPSSCNSDSRNVFPDINEMISENFLEKINECIFIGILGLKSDPRLSEAQLDRFLQIFSKIYKQIFSSVQNLVDVLLNLSNIKEKQQINIKMKKLNSIFDDYSSKYKQLKIIKNCERFVDSETVFLGDRIDTILKNNAQQITNKKETFEYVSIRKTLESVLSCDSFAKAIKEYKNESEFEPLYYSFHPLWEKKMRFALYYFTMNLSQKLSFGN
jgi:hypothetical protein